MYTIRSLTLLAALGNQMTLYCFYSFEVGKENKKQESLLVAIRDKLRLIQILIQTHPGKLAQKLSLCWVNHKWMRHSLPPPKLNIYTALAEDWLSTGDSFLGGGSLRWVWTRSRTCLSSSLVAMNKMKITLS